MNIYPCLWIAFHIFEYLIDSLCQQLCFEWVQKCYKTFNDCFIFKNEQAWIEQLWLHNRNIRHNAHLPFKEVDIGVATLIFNIIGLWKL